jgi:protein-S-isoprenylcysteine O-methyltransferase Ste14
MRRALGISFGLTTQALFGVTVCCLFCFLVGPRRDAAAAHVWLDVPLAMQFSIAHSALLHPRVRRRLGRLISAGFYGSFYCVATCLGLLLAIGCWQKSPAAVWDLTGAPRIAVLASYGASWIALVYSLSLTGLGYQTGLTQWRYWLRSQPLPTRQFAPRGAYNWLRHPGYLSFLGVIWFTPTMSVDRAILTSLWTLYVFVGSVLKDRRMAFYLGNVYRVYQAGVTGYPGMLIGPLAKVPYSPPAILPFEQPAPQLKLPELSGARQAA